MIEIGLDTEMYRLGTSWFSLITKYQKDKTVTYGQYKKCRLRFYRKSYHYEFFLEDRDVGLLYLSIEFELDRFTSNGDPL